MAEPCRLPSCYFPDSRHARVEGATAEENIQPEAEGGNVSSTVSLPDDILFEVLSRLPVKPLCRLRCVSKAWRALISDPAFAAAQSSRAAAAGRPLVVGTFGEPLQVNLRVIDTADGSVVRVVEDVGRSTHRCDPWLAPTRLRLLFVDHGLYGGKVIDPVTGRVTTVAGLKALDDEVNSFEYCHSFLGRAAAPSGAYKIMRVHKNWVGPPEKLQSIEVATLGDTAAATSGEQPTWRQRPVPPFHIVANSRAATVDDDGVVHFMEAEVDVTPTARMRIAAFDLESEEWKAVIYGPPAACPGQEGGDDRGMGCGSGRAQGRFERGSKRRTRPQHIRLHKYMAPRRCCSEYMGQGVHHTDGRKLYRLYTTGGLPRWEGNVVKLFHETTHRAVHPPAL
jgi:hypothetical protein